MLESSYFRKFVDGLENGRHRAILRLAFCDGLRIKEIAKRLNAKLVFVRTVLKKYVELFNSRRCKNGR